MTSTNIEIGDVVTLKSGSADMTVANIFKSSGGAMIAECVWFVRPQENCLSEIRTETIHLIALKKG